MPQAKGKSVTYVTVEDFKSYQAENIRMQNLILQKLGDLETSSNVMNYQQVVQAEPQPKAKTWQEVAREMGTVQTIDVVRIDDWTKFFALHKEMTGKTHIPVAEVDGHKLVVLV